MSVIKNDKVNGCVILINLITCITCIRSKFNWHQFLSMVSSSKLNKIIIIFMAPNYCKSKPEKLKMLDLSEHKEHNKKLEKWW